jgi:RNA polymerase sigma factor (sigma-70 family)
MASAGLNGRGNDNVQLLRAAQRGERRALERLFAQELPPLRRWAHAHVPRWMHARLDPDDMVQLAAIKTLRRLHHLDPIKYPSIQPYMRQATLNLIRDEARRAGRSPQSVPLHDEDAVYQPSPEDDLYARDTWKRYRGALAALTPGQRECIVGRIERGMSYEQIAGQQGRPSAGAARVAFGRALECLARNMRTQRLEPRRETIKRNKSKSSANEYRSA